jgi:hypothetical protein
MGKLRSELLGAQELRELKVHFRWCKEGNETQAKDNFYPNFHYSTHMFKDWMYSDSFSTVHYTTGASLCQDYEYSNRSNPHSEGNGPLSIMSEMECSESEYGISNKFQIYNWRTQSFNLTSVCSVHAFYLSLEHRSSVTRLLPSLHHYSLLKPSSFLVVVNLPFISRILTLGYTRFKISIIHSQQVHLSEYYSEPTTISSSTNPQTRSVTHLRYILVKQSHPLVPATYCPTPVSNFTLHLTVFFLESPPTSALDFYRYYGWSSACLHE